MLGRNSLFRVVRYWKSLLPREVWDVLFWVPLGSGCVLGCPIPLSIMGSSHPLGCLWVPNSLPREIPPREKGTDGTTWVCCCWFEVGMSVDVSMTPQLSTSPGHGETLTVKTIGIVPAACISQGMTFPIVRACDPMAQPHFSTLPSSQPHG